MIITLEGPDGCGKSTVVEALQKTLEDMGYDARRFREPGGTHLGESLRALLLNPETPICKAAQPLLFTTARIQLLEEMKEAFDKGAIVIFDRFWHSTVAYQCGGQGTPDAVVRELNEMSKDVLSKGSEPGDIRRQVVSFHLKVSRETREARLAQTGKTPDRFESETTSFKERVALSYDQLEDGAVASIYGINRLFPVNAEGPVDTVVDRIIEMVQFRLAMHSKFQAGS